ncbi:hypothetical protein CDAR_93661 [Caerostris darwini]|uniref:Uncharacterized protein n=1 Tax=Caerostris darwini TaxID=1538125 RepID=A0AAV4X0Q1_9ARAC|nr:hypothetical protein CDAR_93661 [Caerostris darwini]
MLTVDQLHKYRICSCRTIMASWSAIFPLCSKCVHYLFALLTGSRTFFHIPPSPLASTSPHTPEYDIRKEAGDASTLLSQRTVLGHEAC